ncbi:DNA adenine methylase, partial [Enterococcus cecorum]|nr:DNA adenine methylase [Enterococcus cecorum]
MAKKETVFLKPLFKYPGGKSSEYKHLRELFPKFNTYVEPFLGGGAVYWAFVLYTFDAAAVGESCVFGMSGVVVASTVVSQ